MHRPVDFEAFHRLIKKGDCIRIREVIRGGFDVNVRNRFNWTPLMLAANEGQTPIIQILLSAGADVSAVNDYGVSALAYAALRGRVRAIELLLNAGAPVDVLPHGVSLLKFAGWGDVEQRTLKHFALLKSAGAV